MRQLPLSDQFPYRFYKPELNPLLLGFARFYIPYLDQRRRPLAASAQAAGTAGVAAPRRLLSLSLWPLAQRVQPTPLWSAFDLRFGLRDGVAVERG